MSDGTEKTIAVAFSFVFALYVISVFSEGFFLTAIRELGLFLYLYIPVLTPIAVGYVLLTGRSSKRYTQTVILVSLLLSGGMLAYLLTDGPIHLQTYHKVGGTLLFVLSLVYLYFSKLMLGGNLTLVRHETIVKERRPEARGREEGKEQPPEEVEKTEEVEEVEEAEEAEEAEKEIEEEEEASPEGAPEEEATPEEVKEEAEGPTEEKQEEEVEGGEK